VDSEYVVGVFVVVIEDVFDSASDGDDVENALDDVGGEMVGGFLREERVGGGGRETRDLTVGREVT